MPSGPQAKLRTAARAKRSQPKGTRTMSDRIEEIRADYENISSELTVLPSEYQIGWDDLGFILDTLATRDAEIERLKAVADAAQAVAPDPSLPEGEK